MQIHLFVCFPQPGQSFEKFKEKMKEFDEDKNKKFRKEGSEEHFGQTVMN